MIIQQVIAELETKTHPVALALHKGDSFKVLVMAFKKGMVLKEHKANLPTTLTALYGKVAYDNGGPTVIINQYDEFRIPVSEMHSVEALEDSLCLIIQG